MANNGDMSFNQFSERLLELEDLAEARGYLESLEQSKMDGIIKKKIGNLAVGSITTDKARIPNCIKRLTKLRQRLRRFDISVAGFTDAIITMLDRVTEDEGTKSIPTVRITVGRKFRTLI